MNQQQVTLPFSQQTEKSFTQFMGNEAVTKVLSQPESMPGFIYLKGDKFSGKTHVLQSFENELNANETVCFTVDSMQLTEYDLSQILPARTSHLLVDDIHTLAGNASAELALFNLFNHCKSKNIKLMVTAAIHAKSSAWQLPDLISRLNSGLSLKLELLKGQAALQCFVQQFELNGIPLDVAVIQYLQTHHSSDFATLYQLFLTVSAESLKLKRKVTVPLVKQIIHSNTI